MKNKDLFAPWYQPQFIDDPQAPHNNGRDGPWNQIFWHPEDLTGEERKYYGIDFEYYYFKEKLKSNERTFSIRKVSIS